ncbi:MAG TPA: hypothetical protein VF610_05985 [Segetibacter sp.]|jgi:hypothetical protein
MSLKFTKKFKIKYFLLRLLILLAFFPANCKVFAQTKVPLDTSAITVRNLDEKAIQKFKVDKDFQYSQSVEPPESLWNKFWKWIWARLTGLLSTKQGRVTAWSLLILFAGSAILFFVLKVTGMTQGGLFGRTNNSPLSYDISSEDIHAINFDDAITDAIFKANFRLALRLLYLQSLKNLSDKGYINWQINKTNSDYLAEVYNKPWHSIFKSLTNRFEYTWYGERMIGKDDFDVLLAQFKQFNRQLQ